MRVAWFSPLPPATSGIAAYSAEVLPLIAARGVDIDAFTESNAHDFVWRHRQNAYDVPVFQLGNAACHDFIWAYLFRYPGLVVLHDAQLHQARALYLTKRWQPRRDDYVAELRANHPDAPDDLGELVATGSMSGTLFQHWPHTRLVIESARLVVVHNAQLAAELRETSPGANIEAIEMGVGDPLVRSTGQSIQASVRSRHGIPNEAIVVAAFGGITPEKRIAEVLRALSAVADQQPCLHFMLVGSAVPHYDVLEDARAWRLADRVHVTGFVPDDQLADYLLAADICVCLRWPTNRETSASWLRCLAAGRATLITDLAQLGNVPTLDPRGWRLLQNSSTPQPPVAVSIDLLDEEHSLQLAFERLATDDGLRNRLGRAARGWWEAHHQLQPMADAYVRLLTTAMAIPPPRIALPAHLTDDGTRHAGSLFTEMGLDSNALAKLGIL
jgi:glycosyltransferase involved in cell wall biosynthesis